MVKIFYIIIYGYFFDLNLFNKKVNFLNIYE